MAIVSGIVSNSGSNSPISSALALTDNAILRGDGGNRGVQTSTATIADDGSATFIKTSAAAVTQVLFLNNASTSTGTASALVFALSTTSTTASASVRGVRTNSPAGGAAYVQLQGGNGSSNVDGVRSTELGGLGLPGTITAGGTTGARTIDKPIGQVNFAAAATSLVVTNSLATAPANYIVIATPQANDSTGRVIGVVKGTGSFTIHCTAPASEMPVAFQLITLF